MENEHRTHIHVHVLLLDEYFTLMTPTEVTIILHGDPLVITKHDFGYTARHLHATYYLHHTSVNHTSQNILMWTRFLKRLIVNYKSKVTEFTTRTYKYTIVDS